MNRGPPSRTLESLWVTKCRHSHALRELHGAVGTAGGRDIQEAGAGTRGQEEPRGWLGESRCWWKRISRGEVRGCRRL